MIINLVSVRNDAVLTASVLGDSIVVNGQAFDFAQVGEGDTLPRAAIKSEWFAGDVERTGGQLTITLLLPIPWNFSPEQAFPVPLINVVDGPVVFPSPLPESTIEKALEEMA